MVKTIVWKDNQVVMIDQRKLPMRERYVVCKDYRSVIRAIKGLIIRGAPAIGVAAAMGVAVGALKIRTSNLDQFRAKLDAICRDMVTARPTAVNLAWAVERMKQVADQTSHRGVKEVKSRLVEEARKILEEDIAINRTMGRHGQRLLKDGSRVLTHCNAGALATGGYGTALGVVRAAVEAGKRIEVFADETRPFLQGARLTAWELKKSGIPVTVITDNSAGYFMQHGKVDAVIVGADRIAANGDVANKIGTYMVAVLARTHSVPFYVAAPVSTIDLSVKEGQDIPIEQRDQTEVTHFQGRRIAPQGVVAGNPAFDVTPHRYVSAIITEKGVITPPFKSRLKRLFL
ncbi:MAG: S-methyl-5-thioribose-1-phosphate isomerase [Deltaproteobacteria bacterium]|nr:S-methyl-5-thioribose-1-phosphate isomerase [Deltaproteobacteria bacterium]MBW1795335.1 S-methyl-5-thioribose-1-phosphate isomerase [Deltaproteobacteria bacterium]